MTSQNLLCVVSIFDAQFSFPQLTLTPLTRYRASCDPSISEAEAAALLTAKAAQTP